MRKRIFTSTIAALALFVVVGLVAALAISWPNLARAHSVAGAALTRLTVSPGTLTPAFSRSVHYYTVPVADTVTKITIEATPGGDGTVAYAEADGTALPDADANTPGHQVDLSTAGKRINVEVTHNDAGEVMEETYGVLVIREGPAVPDTIVLMALYDSTNGEGWTTNTNWGSTEPLSAWYQVSVNADGRVEILGPTTPICGGNNLVGTLPAALGNLDQMEQLSLCGNQLSGTIPASLGNLTSLTHLYLNKNQLSGKIPASLDSLTSLVHLYLNENQLTGEIPASLGNLPNLLELYLWGNQLTGEIPASLGNLTTLRKLYLSKNQLTGEIPTSLGNLTELRYLYLDTNQLSGTIPDLSRLTNLQHLYLWGNQLDGRIPDWLGDLTNLQDLFLNNNQLSGEIPDLSRLTNLQSLYLHQNQLSGEIPDLRRLTSLLYLFLDDNQLSGTIPSTRGLTNLQQLSLSRNQLSGRIPDLSFLTSLTRFTASQNQLDGRIPAWLGDFDNLQQLTLDQNQLSGPIPDLSHLTNLTVLQLSENQLSGEIPASLDSLTSLVLLYLHENQLTGEIPASLGNLANLKIARFASNTDAEGNPSLTGCVPGGLRFLVTADEFAPGVPAHDFIAVDANGDGDTDDPDDTPGLNLPFCMLSALDLSDVTLVPSFASGTVAYTASVANTVAATTVTATLNDDGDRLSIKKGTNSYTSGDAVPLDVGSNEITIEVTPPDAALLKQTYTVRLQRAGSAATDRAALMALYDSTGGASWTSKTNWNSAEPIDMWFRVITNGSGRVTALDLSTNNLSGTLPAELGHLTELTSLNLSENQLRGPIPGVRGLTELTTLNLNSNRFNGPVPDWLGDFTNLMTLNLGDNQLNGLIPASLSSLSRLQELYLNGNQLSGTIPASLSNLSLLRDLYLNGNQLSGCVPDGLRAGLTNHDFIAVDANSDGDTADTGDTPGLPFCTLNSLAFSGDVTLNPEFTSSTTTYTASAAHDVAITTVTASLNNSSNTVSIMKGTDTPTTSVPLDVGSNVITIEVTRPDDPLTPHVYTVTVTRQPNTPPAFDEGAAATRGVAENTGTGVDIGDPVAATDPDSGDTLTYSLDAAGAESFDIDASSGQLRTKAALDYETKNSYSVTMSVSDGKDADGNADEMTDNTITVTILVSNVNEALAFPSTTDTRTIPENTDAGVNLGAPFTATDGDNDLLTYSLGSSGNADSFSIDAVSGQLQTKAPLDYETTPSYTVTVTAEDPSGEADTITVTITVTNINEDGTVTLSTVQPLVSTQLFATLADPDRVSGSVTWSWESSPNRSSWTPINGADTDTYTPVTGDQGRYLRATASYDDQESAGKSARAVSANPVRTPTPGNSAPQFSPSETGARSVTENTPAGTDIGAAFAATDSNSGDTLTYSLDAAGAASFDITSATGQLRTKAALDYETIPLHFVTVTATDTAGGSDDIGITITVNNVDEPGTVTLSSLQPQVATQLTATLADPDSFLGSDTWSWESSSDQDSWAVISGATSADYTPVAGAAGNYLRATASYTDGEAAGKSAQAVSANAARGVPGRRAPVFTDGASTTRSVAKSTPAGRNIGAPVSATDADNDALTYSLGGPDGNSFDVGTSSGQLRTKAPLTGIRRTSYSVFVSVSDNKDDEGMPETPPQIDTTTAVTILVTEVNEAPVFPSATATRTIPENTPAGRNIGAPVAATDPDNDALTYSLGGDDAASFDIDTSSGQLRTKAALDHEAKPEYSVTVIATDASSLMAELEVTITVGNVEEEGSVALFPAQPRVGTVLRATLSDPDGELRSVNWQWERSSDQTNWTSRSGSGPSYTPTSGDEGMYLRASASYTDGEGTGKSAEAASDHSVGAHDAAPDITVVELVSGLSIPWDLAFTPDGAMLFTQRPGVLSARLTDGTVQTVTADFGDLYVSREAGLMAIVIDPSFASNRRFYTCQTHAGPTVQVIAWTINAAFTAATRVNDPLVGGIPAASFHDGCRLRFGPQGYLWIATGDGASGTVPQDLTSLGGKVLRVDASTGAGAPGNPFASSPRVYTYGHRNPQGLARRPGTSQMWSVEHGPNIDDEINLLVKGGNYGWDPVPAYNQAVPMTDLGQFPGAIEARWSSGDPTLATSGGIFLDGDDWDEWEGRLAVATLKASELHIFDFTANGTFVSQVVVLELDGTYGRLRTPMMGPDGALYLTTSNGSDDRILKVVPSLPPTFPGETDTQAVDENRSASTIVATVTATDPEGQALTYTLSGRDAASFTIPNSAAGRLRAKATLNHEDRSSYQVIVTAADPYGLSDSVTLTISVTDVNETPAFPSSETGVRRVAETTAAGVNIGAPVAATDADNDALTYSLGGTDAGSFDIVSGTGQLQTKASLDGASGNSYSVTVSVRDSKDDEGNPDTTTDSTIAVTILVTEVNEAPVFPSAMATRTIPENTPAGVNIGAPVAATDPDNDALTYSLNGADAGSFDIVSGTGQLQTKASLDGASGNSYSVTVSVRDSKDDEGNPDTTTDSTIAVTILVTEVNEAPVFPSATPLARSRRTRPRA